MGQALSTLQVFCLSVIHFLSRQGPSCTCSRIAGEVCGAGGGRIQGHTFSWHEEHVGHESHLPGTSFSSVRHSVNILSSTTLFKQRGPRIVVAILPAVMAKLSKPSKRKYRNTSFYFLHPSLFLDTRLP